MIFLALIIPTSTAPFLSSALVISPMCFVAFSAIIAANRASGFLLMRNPITSFSISESSSSEYSARCSNESTTCLCSTCPANKPNCPFDSLSFESAISFTISGYTPKIVAQFANCIKAPDLARLSIVFLFTFLKSTFMRKSLKPVRGPTERASMMESIAALPTFLIADRPNRILLPSMVKSLSDLLMSGGSTGISILLHSSIA